MWFYSKWLRILQTEYMRNQEVLEKTEFRNTLVQNTEETGEISVTHEEKEVGKINTHKTQ